MGIKCSLLGHDFGEATVERDREEQGSEVVITIREVETCSRCGETRVVSENKEVTSLETPEDVGAPVEDAGSEDDAESPGTVEAEADASATDPTPDADTGGVADAEESPTTGTGDPPATGGAVTGEADPAEEDAEILDDGSDRDPGEWPQEADSDDADEDEAGDGFDQYEYSDPEADPPVEGDDAEFIDADDDDEPRRTNAWPSESEDEPDPSGPGAITVPEGEFVCDACGFSTPVAESSLREGDFCPECQEATVVQRTDGRK